MKKTAIVILLLTSLFGCTENLDSENELDSADNAVPMANAGTDQNIITATIVTLNGSTSSDSDGNSLSYSWSLLTVPTASSARLTNSTSVLPTFTADIDGSYVAQLIVNDGTVDSLADTVTIVAASNNSLPVANAGADQNIVTTTAVTLNGSTSSDSNSNLLSYSWSLLTVPTGSSATLTNLTSVSPTFTADIDGSYVAQLIVNDGTVDSLADTVTIVAASNNSLPVANAGADQNIVTTTVVTLNGSTSSDSDGNSLSYSWALLTVPTGSSATLTNLTSVSPTFTADIDGSYVAQLIVNDGTVDSIADTVTVVAASNNSLPVANAGADQNVLAETTVLLNASRSTDADADGLSYAWSFVSKPIGSLALLDNNMVENPSFTPDINGSYVIRLVVNDGLKDSAPDNIIINAINPTVTLYKEGDIFGGNFKYQVSLPYSSNEVVNTNVSGIPTPTTYSLGTFKLLAEGQNFTIINLVVTGGTSTVVPFFTVISEGYQLVDGTEVTFELISPLTQGATATLNFNFEIQETGDTFSSSYTFTSN